jgi:hypothetical protein
MGCQGQWPAPGAQTFYPTVFTPMGAVRQPYKWKGHPHTRLEDALSISLFTTGLIPVATAFF